MSALSGVRVIELAHERCAFAGKLLADMGAEVIKIEPPEGDGTRYISVGPVSGMSGIFVNVNRGKRSVVLDLRSDAGKRALRKLIEKADVFIHSMRAKAVAKLGFAYDDVAAINPAIIYTNCYGYGHRGPDRDRPAYDDTIQAECGLPAVQQQLTGEADYVGTIMADKVAGLTALYATTMALFHRERTGQGQEVEVAMFETMASFMLVEHANGAMFDPPLGPAVYPRTVAPNPLRFETTPWSTILIQWIRLRCARSLMRTCGSELKSLVTISRSPSLSRSNRTADRLDRGAITSDLSFWPTQTLLPSCSWACRSSGFAQSISNQGV